MSTLQRYAIPPTESEWKVDESFQTVFEWACGRTSGSRRSSTGAA
ncbi:MAG: hypothetical protein RL698_2574 [Pseudomonadota bacterium]